MGMRICGQNPRTDADATFQDPHISGLRRESSADLRVWFGPVRFRPEQICAVTDSVSEQQWSVHSISIFYAIWYSGHPLALTENLRRSSQGNPAVGGFKSRGVTKYSDFSPLKCCTIYNV